MTRRSTALCWCAALAVVAVSCRKDPEKLKQEFFASAEKYVAENKYQEAIVQYRNAISTDPRFGEAHYRIAEAFTHEQNLRQALIEYIRAADLMPTNVEAQLR